MGKKTPANKYKPFTREVFVADTFDRTNRAFFVSPEVNGKVLVLKLWNYDGIFFDPPLSPVNKDGSVAREFTYNGVPVVRW